MAAVSIEAFGKEIKNTGISPLNPNEVLARLPEETKNYEDIKDAVDKSFINLLKEMRYGSINIVEPKNKRKIDVISGRSVSQDDVESYAETDTAPVKKKSLKGKGVGKRTKKISNNKENKPASPAAHCSYGSDPIIDQTINLLSNEKECHFEQHSDWCDIDIEKIPVVLSPDLEFYKETILPYNSKEISEINVKEETNLIEIENVQYSLNSEEVGSRTEGRNENDETNEKPNLNSTSNNNSPNIIITSNIAISQEQLNNLLPKNPIKQNIKPVAVNKKDNIIKKKKKLRLDKNYFNATDEILKILREQE